MGVGIGVTGAITMVALSMLTPSVVPVLVMPLVAAALIVGAVAMAAWNPTIALTAAVSVAIANILAFVAQAAIGLSGALIDDGTLSNAATTWLGVLITLGTSWLVTNLAAAFLGGWLLARILARRGSRAAETA